MFGVGSMWTEESEDLKAYEGFDEAPYMNSFQGWPIGSGDILPDFTVA